MDVFDLCAKIGLDKSEYEAGVKDAKGSMSNLASSIGNGLKTVAKVSATAIAAGAAGVAALTKMSVQGYAEFEQLVGGVETLFKTSQDVVMGYAENAYKTAGMSSNAYMETITSFSASLIQSLGGDTEKAAEVGNMAITDMSDNANKMGTSMEMIQNAYNGFAKQNYTMLDNLKLGYGGTQEEMKRLIADANKVKEANGEMADLSIDSFADVAEAIHIIQTEMGITGTTAREAATTIEGSLGMMKGAWQNLVVGMADENANMEVLMNNFVESTVTVAGNIMPRIEQALKGVGQLIEGLAPVIADALPGLVSSVLPSLLNAAVGLVGSLASALPSLVEMLVNDLLPQLLLGVVTITTSLVSALPQLIETIASALPSLIHLLINDGLVPLVLAICANLPLILAPIIAELPNILLSVSDALLQNLDVLIQGLVDLCLAIIPMIPQIILSLLDAAPKIISMVTDALIKSAPILGKGLMQICKSMATEMLNYWKQFPEKLLEIGRSVINLFSELFSPVAEWFNTNVIQPVAQFFADLWQGVCDGVSAAWGWISGICSTVGSWIYNNVIAPVAKFFTDLWNGIVNAWHTVIDPWVEIVKRLATMFYDSVIKPVADFFADLWRKITKGAREAWNGVVSVYSVVSGWFNEKIIQPVSNFFSKMWSGLKSGASSAWSGITSVFSNVTSWFRDKFTQAWTAVKNVFSTGGKVFDGIKDGIVSVFKTVVNAIIGGINKVIKVPFDAINSALKKIRNVEIVGVKPFDWITTFNVPQIPKLSTGLNFVPYDEYPAFLHRGEAVLTASQARAWRNGGTVGNGQIVSVLVSILDAITGGNKELLEAILSGHVIALNEREVGRVVKTYA